MKSIFLFSYLLFTVTIQSCNSQAQNNKMIIDLKLTSKEASKDSNSETVTIQVYENKVIFNKSHSGFKAPKDKSKKFRIKEKELQNIVNEFESLGLNKNLSETKSTQGIGVSGFLEIEFNDQLKTVIKIEGKTNIWGADDYVEKNWGKEFVESRTNITNIEYFSKAERFINFVLEFN